MNAKEIAGVFTEMAALLELTGANPFRARAYQNVARALEGVTEDIETLVREDRLGEVSGVGKGLAASIAELVTTGSLKDYDELREKVPDGVLEILELPGLGPKRVRRIWEELGVTNIGELEYACRENRLAALDGFGEKTQTNVLKAIAFRVQGRDRHLYHRARAAADAVLELVKSQPGVIRVEIAGSLRRHRETIGDLDILASASDDARPGIMDAFVKNDDIVDVIAHGSTKSSVRLKSGINADLRVVSDEEFPFALAYFTGSKEHNTVLRGRAKREGLKLNEYGLFRENSDTIPCENETNLYRALGLPYIPPELRENMGEFEAAERNELPDLVTMDDIRGILHVHTVRSDGVHTVEQLVQAAKTLGAEYLGIADHSRSAFYAGGLSENDVRAQWDEIDEVNERIDDITVLKGIESDILSDGGLDYNDELLAGFDFVIASVHSRLHMAEDEATERLLRAIDHPATTILGHPTGRLLLARDGYPVDMQRVIERCVERGVAIELNASPHRLDLDWRWCRNVREHGGVIA
ncbi:MAG TPA: DNA polymerase/3'-5' exonuclease PolX, partial [Firmicutes bacterium]|nr:DNA polymerase/3'-5' exonuclease PolX [Bacillota bacterium]